MADEYLIEEIPLEIEEEVDEDEVPMSYDIATYPSDFTLAGISQMWKDGDISIPDFQREFVWKIKQASLLIDSFLRGLPVPPVFFYIGDDNKNLVIDGQQRILSVVYFIEGYFGPEGSQGKRQVFRLKGLGEKSPFLNKRFVDLTSADQRKLKQAVLRAVNIKQLSPVGNSTSAYHIFERLNTGGTPLASQEIRNCVFMGSFSTQLKALNKDKNWRLIIGKPHIDRHQKDVEILLRVFALVGKVKEYEKPLKEFLNRAMKDNQNGNSVKVKRFIKNLPTALDTTVKALGPKPFHVRGPLNASALDAVLCVMLENPGKISSAQLKSGYTKLKNDKNFQKYTQRGTTDAKTVQDRVALVEKYLAH
jgi:uncharacterized protein YdeI (YjbR/CyaY-like superfamily)